MYTFTLPLTTTFSGSSFDLSICPNIMSVVDKFKFSTQCAAVSTNSELIREPPQKPFMPIDISTCQGYCPLLAGSQPIHFDASVIVVEKFAHSCGGGGHGHGLSHCSESPGLSQLAHFNLQESGYVNPSDPHTSVPGSGSGVAIEQR